MQCLRIQPAFFMLNVRLMLSAITAMLNSLRAPLRRAVDL
jgi:hypothetical protein